MKIDISTNQKIDLSEAVHTHKMFLIVDNENNAYSLCCQSAVNEKHDTWEYICVDKTSSGASMETRRIGETATFDNIKANDLTFFYDVLRVDCPFEITYRA